MIRYFTIWCFLLMFITKPWLKLKLLFVDFLPTVSWPPCISSLCVTVQCVPVDPTCPYTGGSQCPHGGSKLVLKTFILSQHAKLTPHKHQRLRSFFLYFAKIKTFALNWAKHLKIDLKLPKMLISRDIWKHWFVLVQEI